MSKARKHVLQEKFEVAAGEMFEALCTPSAICGWWNASTAIVLPKPNGVWVAAWGEDEDAPDYIAAFVIKTYDPPKRIVLGDTRYFAKTGQPPFKAEMTTEFVVEPTSNGCLLKVVQDGFPAEPVADEFYRSCETGWKDTFNSIRGYFG